MTCSSLAQALNNVNPAAVLRPSGTVVSIKCVEKIIKKDMVDPFTGALEKIAQGTIKEGVLGVLSGAGPGTHALTLRPIGVDARLLSLAADPPTKLREKDIITLRCEGTGFAARTDAKRLKVSKDSVVARY